MADLKTFTRKEVSEWNAKGAAVFIIDNVAYDVSAFLDEHPGGHEVLVAAGGGDASEEFHDVGHSADAKELMHKYAVGALTAEERVQRPQRAQAWGAGAAGPGGAPPPPDAGLLSSWKLPVLVGVLLTLLYSYLLA